MKSVIYSIFLIILVGVVFLYRNTIANFLTDKVIMKEKEPVAIKYNNYKYGDWQYVHNVTDFTAHKYEDFNNLFYTILNSGETEFSFQCSEEYESCKNDVQNYINNDADLGNINNLVHPYNSFKNIQVTITNHGKVTILINHIYTEEEINYVNNQIETFINQNINTSMSEQDKIKAFHDYIINNTKYDQSAVSVADRINLASYNAYGLFTNHLAICGGYTDAIAIYLNMLGITNYRVATTSHIWNLVNIDNKFLHIDATWDDPVTSDGSDQLLYDYFLIDANKLHQSDSQEHNFNTNLYIEAN